jgi:hypothetical protein
MMPEELLDRLQRLAPSVDADAALVAVRRPGRRRARYVVAALFMLGSLVTVGLLFRQDDDSRPERVTAGRNGATSTTTSTIPVRLSPADSLLIVKPLPTGWKPVPGPLFVQLRPIPPEATVATFDVPAEPSRSCDIPGPALERLGPNDAFVSVVESRAPTTAEPRPAALAFLPRHVALDQLPPDQRDLNVGVLCLRRTGDFRYKETLFLEHGRFLRVFVGMGLSAGPAVDAQVLDLIDHIVVEPPEGWAVIGKVFVNVPDDAVVEDQHVQDAPGGVRWHVVSIRLARVVPDARAGPLCQVWSGDVPAGTYPPETRPTSVVRITPVDGSPPFDMKRIEGVDTDLSGAVGSTTFNVDCDDLPTAESVATHLILPK